MHLTTHVHADQRVISITDVSEGVTKWSNFWEMSVAETEIHHRNPLFSREYIKHKCHLTSGYLGRGRSYGRAAHIETGLDTEVWFLKELVQRQKWTELLLNGRKKRNQDWNHNACVLVDVKIKEKFPRKDFLFLEINTQSKSETERDTDLCRCRFTDDWLYGVKASRQWRSLSLRYAPTNCVISVHRPGPEHPDHIKQG